MQLYGYKSGYSKSIKHRGGICYCCCCSASERRNRNAKKRNRKRARRWAKQAVKEQILS